MKTTRPIFPVPALPFTSERLLFRPYRPSDAGDLFILRSQSEVMKWTSSKIPDADVAKTREWMAPALPPLNSDSFRFVIEERSNPGKVVGVIGSRFSEPPECGYMFRTDMWGKGYGAEYGTEAESLLAETELGNAGSRRVLVKCGFTELQTWEDDGDQLIQYIYRPSS
jgi:RimJ/RimL family protein N-acetyltransferase